MEVRWLPTATIRPFQLGGSLNAYATSASSSNLTQKQLARALGGTGALSIATVSLRVSRIRVGCLHCSG